MENNRVGARADRGWWNTPEGKLTDQSMTYLAGVINSIERTYKGIKNSAGLNREDSLAEYNRLRPEAKTVYTQIRTKMLELLATNALDRVFESFTSLSDGPPPPHRMSRIARYSMFIDNLEKRSKNREREENFNRKEQIDEEIKDLQKSIEIIQSTVNKAKELTIASIQKLGIISYTLIYEANRLNILGIDIESPAFYNVYNSKLITDKMWERGSGRVNRRDAPGYTDGLKLMADQVVPRLYNTFGTGATKEFRERYGLPLNITNRTMKTLGIKRNASHLPNFPGSAEGGSRKKKRTVKRKRTQRKR